MAKNIAGLVGRCCLLAAAFALVGCRKGTYNVSFGLVESNDEDFRSAERLRVDPLRSRRERDTDRTAHDLDGDGIPDARDTDIDGDGVPNDQDPDDDNDGIPDEQDPDSNNDGIIDDLDR